MEWIDLDAGKKSWSNFWKTVLYPLYIWILIIMFLYFWLITATNFENLEIFENAIAFIPSIIGSTIGVMSTLGTLVLTLFIHVRSETKYNTLHSESRSAAYQKYATLITHFLGGVWFWTFLYRIWIIPNGHLDNNIPNHGKFLSNPVKIDIDIPIWIFLFLSWFVLSVGYQLSNQVYGYRQGLINLQKIIYKFEKYRTDDYRLSRYILMLMGYGAENVNSNISKDLKSVFPGKSGKLYIGYIGDSKNMHKKFFIASISIASVLFIWQIPISMLIMHLLFSFNFGMSISASIVALVGDIVFASVVSGIIFYSIGIYDISKVMHKRSSIITKIFKVRNLEWVVLVMFICVACSINSIIPFGFLTQYEPSDINAGSMVNYLSLSTSIFTMISSIILIFFFYISSRSVIETNMYVLNCIVGGENFKISRESFLSIAKIVYLQETSRRICKNVLEQSGEADDVYSHNKNFEDYVESKIGSLYSRLKRSDI